MMLSLEALRFNTDMLIAGLDVYHIFELKGNLTDSKVWNTGEAGDMNTALVCPLLAFPLYKF